jgi:hypothetical protein
MSSRGMDIGSVSAIAMLLHCNAGYGAHPPFDLPHPSRQYSHRIPALAMVFAVLILPAT